MKAINVFSTGSGPAPKEWEEIEQVKDSMPHPIGQEVSLQKVD